MFNLNYTSRVIACAGFVVACAGISTATAGVISTNFNSGLPAGTSLYGNAFLDNGILKLTEAENGQFGVFYINDLDSGSPVTNFTATFRSLFGGASSGSGSADGMSFNFATDLPSPDYLEWENGVGTGLSVTFDTFAFDNQLDDIGVEVKWGGTRIGFVPGQVSQGPNGNSFFDVFINLDLDGTLDVRYNGIDKFVNFATGYSPISGGRFGFGARTGGLNDNHWIDDLTIVTNQGIVPEPTSLAVFSILGLGSLLPTWRHRRRNHSHSTF